MLQEIILGKIFLVFFKKFFRYYQFLPSIHDFIETKQYYSKIIDGKKVNFFCPSRSFLILEILIYGPN